LQDDFHIAFSPRVTFKASRVHEFVKTCSVHHKKKVEEHWIKYPCSRLGVEPEKLLEIAESLRCLDISLGCYARDPPQREYGKKVRSISQALIQLHEHIFSLLFDFFANNCRFVHIFLLKKMDPSDRFISKCDCLLESLAKMFWCKTHNMCGSPRSFS